MTNLEQRFMEMLPNRLSQVAESNDEIAKELKALNSKFDSLILLLNEKLTLL